VNLGLVAVASGTLVAGAVAALGIAAGATVTLAVIAVIGIGARAGLVRVPWIGAASQASRIVAAVGWLVATAASAAFLWGSWTRLR
jgi:ABC-type nickel/cobalt efflux system permease component RcnA